MRMRTLVAVLVGAIAMFFCGWLIYGLLLMSYFKAHMIQYTGLVKDPPQMIPLVLANLAWAWLIAFIFDRWAGIRTFGSGVMGGALIMLPLILGIELQYWAFMNWYTDSAPMFVSVAAGTVMGALTGGVIGLTLGLLDRDSGAR